MSISNTWKIFARDFWMGPRTIMAIWLIIFPLLITFVVRLVFGGFIDSAPQPGVVDYGESVIPVQIVEDGTIELTEVADEATLMDMMEAGDLDAGLILQADFNEAVRSGANPELQLYVGGSSLASNRIVLAVTTMDLIRGIAGEPAPVEVEVELAGDAPGGPIEERFVPLLVLLAVTLAGIFLPAAGLIQERTNHTIDAVLLTRATMGDFILAKGTVGFLMSFGVGVITLLINGGFTACVGGLLLVIAVGALMSVQLGIILGSVIPDMQTMFTVWKGGAIVLFAPAMLFLFPGVPEAGGEVGRGVRGGCAR